MNRPIGVAILAIVALMMSVISLVRGLALAILGGVASRIGTQAGGSVTIVAGLILIASALCAWAFANAAWNFKPWGRTFGLVAEDLALLGAALNIMQGGSANNEIVGMIVAFVIVAYLMMPNVRRAFSRNHLTVAAYEHA